MFVLFPTDNTGALESSWGGAGPDGPLQHFYFMGLIVLCSQLQDRPCNFWMIPENIRPRRAVSRRCVMQLELRSQLAPLLLTPHPLWMKDVSGEAKVERRLVLQPHCPPMQAWPTPTITRSYITPPCYSISTWNVFSSPVRQGLSHSQEFHSSGLYRHVAIYAKSLKWCTCVWANSSWKLLIWCSCCGDPITCTCDSFSLFTFNLRQEVVVPGDSVRVCVCWNDCCFISLRGGPTDSGGSPGEWPELSS